MKASRGFWITIAILLLATAIYYPYSPGGRQRRNMNLAAQHIEKKLKPLIANDSRFADVKLSPYTASFGSLLVSGDVASQEDVEALKAIVRSTHPPTEVHFYTRIEPKPISATQPISSVSPMP